MKKLIYITSVFYSLLLASCNNEPTLQKYFVNNSESKDFVIMDLALSALINIDSITLTTEEKKAFETFKKINIIAFKANETNQKKFEEEREKITTILKNKKYQDLIKGGKGKEGFSLQFVGDEDHIEEFVLFANQKEDGFAVVRILGKNMDSTQLMKIIDILRKSNINMEQLKPFKDLMEDNK